MKKGFTLIDIIIGIGLILLAFMSIYGVFKLGTELIGRSKAKVGALALTNERMEIIRNLAYDDIGTISGIPAGNIPQTEEISLNGIKYTRRVLAQYVDAPEDGQGALDENGIMADYKRVKVETSWASKIASSSVVLISDIMPKGIETNIGGGTLIINVFDASAIPVAGATVHIENSTTNPTISTDISTNSAGKVIFPGSPTASSYEITVTKSGFSGSQTYGNAPPNVSPDPTHLTIIEGNTTQASFVIDLTAVKTVKTWEPPRDSFWPDLFDNDSKISSSTDIVIANGKVELASSTGYGPTGFLYSIDISPTYLNAWQEFSWNDTTVASTSIKYQLYYYDPTPAFALVPDVDLPGNSVGFTTSPVDISALDTANYATLAPYALLETEDASSTPTLFDWQISYREGPIPIGNINFNMRGEKTIGRDSGNNLIYKYNQSLQTNSVGQITIPDLEFDIYNLTIDGVATGYDISESCSPQSVNILPGIATTTDLYLVPNAANSLLVVVKDTAGGLVKNANARLYRSGYDTTQAAASCGQTFFTPLITAINYSLDVTATGYTNINLTNIDVTGYTTIEVIMNLL